MKIISITGKVSDCFNLHTDDGLEYDGYVPEGTSLGGGDYLEFQVENSTGRIIGWKPMTPEDIGYGIDGQDAE